jgi:hypothetical protein
MEMAPRSGDDEEVGVMGATMDHGYLQLLLGAIAVVLFMVLVLVLVTHAWWPPVVFVSLGVAGAFVIRLAARI